MLPLAPTSGLKDPEQKLSDARRAACEEQSPVPGPAGGGSRPAPTVLLGAAPGSAVCFPRPYAPSALPPSAFLASCPPSPSPFCQQNQGGEQQGQNGAIPALRTASSEGAFLPPPLFSVSPATHIWPPAHPSSMREEFGVGQGLLASPQEANPLPRSRTFLGEKKMGASLLPRILFSSVRCFLCTCFVLPVHFGGQSFLSPTTPALSRSAPGLQPLGIASWGGGGGGPWVSPHLLSFWWLSLWLAETASKVS